MKRSEHNPFLIWCDVCTMWRDEINVDDHCGAKDEDGMTICAACQQTRAFYQARLQEALEAIK